MIKVSKITCLFFIVLIGFSCEDQLGQFGGPVYDQEGNLAADREIIAEYLDTASYDSLYRIHDPSGVVVIVTEEGGLQAYLRECGLHQLYRLPPGWFCV